MLRSLTKFPTKSIVYCLLRRAFACFDKLTGDKCQRQRRITIQQNLASSYYGEFRETKVVKEERVVDTSVKELLPPPQASNRDDDVAEQR